MIKGKVIPIYQASILIQSVLLPSALYGLSLATLAVSFFCWIYIGDYKNVRLAITKPQLLCPIILYSIIVIGFFFASHFNNAVQSLSAKIPYFVFPIIIGSSSIVNNEIVLKSCKWFIAATTISLAIALIYATIDVYKSGIITVALGENIFIHIKLT